MLRRERQDPLSLSRLAIVQAQGEHLLGLIGALLDVSRIETGAAGASPGAVRTLR
jgi:signal transduction histidine kinase